MANGNHITIVGNCTRDPELRFTAAGSAMAKFGVAVNRRWQNRSTQEWEEEVSFFDVIAWGALGENAVESIQKGTRVMVDGRLQQRSWETDQGEKRSSIELVADELGPSLRWATAQVVKNDRSETSNFAPAQAHATPGQAAPSYDEEPF